MLTQTIYCMLSLMPAACWNKIGVVQKKDRKSCPVLKNIDTGRTSHLKLNPNASGNKGSDSARLSGKWITAQWTSAWASDFTVWEDFSVSNCRKRVDVPNFFDMIVKNSHRLCSRARLGRTEAEWETILWSQFEIHSLTNTTDTEQYVNIVSGTTCASIVW